MAATHHVPASYQVIKAGLMQFPKSAFLHILYSSFLIEHRKQDQVGRWSKGQLQCWDDGGGLALTHRGSCTPPQVAAGLLEEARKMYPSYGEAFMLFVREREVRAGWEGMV